MHESGAGPADAELDGLRRRFDSVLARMQREERRNERKATRDRFQRDMGIGYLLYVARRYRRMPQWELARRMRTSRTVVTRWEKGGRLPTLMTLEKLAAATDLELLIGLRDPEDPEGDLLALGIVFDEGRMTELLMLIDQNIDQLPVTPWRARMVKENPESAALLL